MLTRPEFPSSKVMINLPLLYFNSDLFKYYKISNTICNACDMCHIFTPIYTQDVRKKTFHRLLLSLLKCGRTLQQKSSYIDIFFCVG